MKKFLIASGVAVLAFATVASAQGATFVSNLTVGSTGPEVAALQTKLIAEGFAIPSISSGAAAPGYFGAQTKTAVMAYQAKNISAAPTGFVGPLTRDALNGKKTTGGSAAGSLVIPFPCPAGYVAPAPWVCPNSTGTGSVGLTGTDGAIDDVNELSQYSNEEVGEGESDVKVLGFEVETSNDGDILLKSIKVSFDPAGNGASDSDHLDDYIDGVSVWMGSTEIGSADVDEFSENDSNVFTKTITLKSGVIVKADSTEKFYVAVDGAGSFDSSDIDSDGWVVDVDNIRFEDGSGVVTTEDSAGDLGAMNVAIDFVNFATSADTELKISKDSSSPDASIIMVDDENDTDNQVVLVGKLKLDGTSDVVIDELPITFSTNGDSVQAVINSVTLKLGDEEYTESVSTSGQSGTITFDNLDFTIDAGKTVTFTVLADINDVNDSGVTATDFDEGDAITASLTSTNRSYIDAENEEGDQLSSSEKTGTAIGEGQELRTEGIGLTLVRTATSATVGQSSNDDVGLFTIEFKVTAFGDTVYLSSLGTSAGYTYSVDKSGTATTSNAISAAITNKTDTDLTSVGNYEIEDGETETFELTVSVPLGTGGTSGQYRTTLTGVKWDTSDDTSMANTYSSELDSFKTSYIVLN